MEVAAVAVFNGPGAELEKGERLDEAKEPKSLDGFRRFADLTPFLDSPRGGEGGTAVSPLLLSVPPRASLLSPAVS